MSIMDDLRALKEKSRFGGCMGVGNGTDLWGVGKESGVASLRD